MTNLDSAARLRGLPQVDKVINAIDTSDPPALKAAAAREAIALAKQTVLDGGETPAFTDIVATAVSSLQRGRRGRLVKVINATGVLIHTNMGRSPLSAEAARAIERVASSYTNLEYDIEAGRRGSRYDHCAGLINALTGAEASLVVNNNAAAVILSLAVLARGREVIVSRGELVEIGGGFRIPDIMSESGAELREVGTTNRTTVEDYSRAINERTAAIMKVHPSNYRITGFTASVSSAELAGLARARNVAFINDLGSGLIDQPGDVPWLDGEPTVRAAVAEGADVVTFSGDKLMGGPQAGIIAGSRDAIALMREHPLLRALRVDKMTIAALEATAIAHLRGEANTLPVWRAAMLDTATLEARARAIADTLVDPRAKVDLVDGWSTSGGGSAPSSKIPAVLLAISPREASVKDLMRLLIDSSPPIVARVDNEMVLIDLRTVDPADDGFIAGRLQELL